MAAVLLPQGKQQFFTSTGAPGVGYKLYTYVAGTSTPKDSYTSHTGLVANANPVIADSRGEMTVYFSGDYDVTLKDASDVTIWGPLRVNEFELKGAASTAVSNLAASSGSSLVGFVQSGSGATTRTAQAKMREVFTVEDFGATGDGATDDTSAVANALDAAVGAGVKLLFKPGKTYLLSTWTEYSTTSPVIIEATGATIRGPAAGNVGFMSVGANLFVNGGKFTRWGTWQRRNLAQSGSITEMRVENCTFDTFTGIVIDIERPLSYYWISDNKFTSVANYAIHIGENTYANQDLYQKGTIKDNKFTTITASGATSCAAMLVYGREVDIIGNYIYGVSGSTGEGWGIYTKTRYGKVVDNTVRNIKSASSSDVIGINIKGTTRAVTSSPQGYSMIVSDNHIQDVGVNGTAGGGIRIQTDDVLCVGNLIEDTGLSGISSDEASAYYNVTIDSNQIRFDSVVSGTSGVRIEGQGNGIVVRGSLIKNCYIGVRVQANYNMTDVHVHGNSIQGCTYPLLFDAQTSMTLDYCRFENNIADGGTAGIINNGSAGTTTNLSIINNSLDRCGIFMSGTLPAGSYVADVRTLTTTNATPTNIIGISLADESAFMTEAKVVARQSGSGNRAMYHLDALHYRDGGSATQQGSTASLAAVESNAAWDCAFAVSTNDVALQATGVAATTIYWKAETKIIGV